MLSVKALLLAFIHFVTYFKTNIRIWMPYFYWSIHICTHFCCLNTLTHWISNLAEHGNHFRSSVEISHPYRFLFNWHEVLVGFLFLFLFVLFCWLHACQPGQMLYHLSHNSWAFCSGYFVDKVLIFAQTSLDHRSLQLE